MAHINNTPKNEDPLDTPVLFDRNWYVGAYVTRPLKVALQNEARAAKRSVSQQLITILEDRYETPQPKPKGKRK